MARVQLKKIVKAAMEKCFPGCVTDRVYSGEDDPGEWAPDAAVVIHVGSPLDVAFLEGRPAFFSFCDMVSDGTGNEYFVEPVNASVWAIYKA